MDSVLHVAIPIIGLVLVLLLFPLTYLFHELSQGVGDESSEQAAVAGMIMLVMWLITSLSVLSFPLVSAAVFAIAGLGGFALDGGFPNLDLWVGPAISMVLAVLSYLGWSDQRRNRQSRSRVCPPTLHENERWRDPSVMLVSCPSASAACAPGMLLHTDY